MQRVDTTRCKYENVPQSERWLGRRREKGSTEPQLWTQISIPGRNGDGVNRVVALVMAGGIGEERRQYDQSYAVKEGDKNEFNLLSLGKCKNGHVIDPNGDVIGNPKNPVVEVNRKLVRFELEGAMGLHERHVQEKRNKG